MSIHHKPLTAAAVEPLLRGRFGRPYLWSESCASTQDVLRGIGSPGGRGRGDRAPDLRARPRGAAVGGRRREGAPALAAAAAAGGHRRRSSSRSSPGSRSRRRSRSAGTPRGSSGRTTSCSTGRKVAGVLLESSDGDGRLRDRRSTSPRTRASFRPARRCAAGSLVGVTGTAPDRAALLASLLEILEHRYDAWRRSGLAALLDELEARNVLRGQPGGGAAGQTSGSRRGRIAPPTAG